MKDEVLIETAIILLVNELLKYLDTEQPLAYRLKVEIHCSSCKMNHSFIKVFPRCGSYDNSDFAFFVFERT